MMQSETKARPVAGGVPVGALLIVGATLLKMTAVTPATAIALCGALIAFLLAAKGRT